MAREAIDRCVILIYLFIRFGLNFTLTQQIRSGNIQTAKPRNIRETRNGSKIGGMIGRGIRQLNKQN